MADQLQLRRGTTAQNNLFTGAQGELVMDTDLHTLRLHDGMTLGGFGVASTIQISEGTFYYNDNTGGGSAANAYILSAKTNTNTPGAYKDGVQFGFVTANANTGASTANFQGLGVKNIKYPGNINPPAGDISGRVYLIYDAANDWLELQRRQATPQLRTVSATVAANAMTVGIQPSVIEFRSATIGSGVVNTRTVSAAISLVIPSGATLGTQNGVSSRIAILAVDNTGTVQLAVVNMAGGINLDETTLIDVVAISGAATSATAVYSSSTVSGLPFRVIGYVQSTQATAGTWATAPSAIQGQGGQNVIGAAKITLSTPAASTSGVAIDFTGIPPGTKRITMMVNAASTNGTSVLQVQLGAGSIDAVSYQSMAIGGAPGNNVSGATSTTGFVFAATVTAATSNTGVLTIINISGNNWIATGTSGVTGATTGYLLSGVKTLAGVLDRVRLTTVNGTDVFDAGTVNILYEG